MTTTSIDGAGLGPNRWASRPRAVGLVAALAGVVILSTCLPAAAAVGPTELWYRISVRYRGVRYDEALYSRPNFHCCWATAKDTLLTKTVEWRAHSKGAVLVQVQPATGDWVVVNGTLIGNITKAEITLTGREQALGAVSPSTVPSYTTDCVTTTKTTLAHKKNGFTMPVQIDTIPTQQPFRIWFNALTPETSVSQPPTGLQHETGNNTSCWQRRVDGLFLAPPDAIVPYPSPMPFRPDFTDTQRAGEGLLRPFRFAPGGHVKFGANHIVFGIGGDVSVQPLVIAGPFANTATFTSSGHEELVVTLRRCPGTARC